MGPVAAGAHACSPLCAQDSEDYNGEGLRKSICVSGSAVDSLDECRPPRPFWVFWGAIVLGVCGLAISLWFGIKMWRKREAAACHKTTENSGLLKGRGSAG